MYSDIDPLQSTVFVTGVLRKALPIRFSNPKIAIFACF